MLGTSPWFAEHWFELLAAAISAVDVWLATKRSMISWPVTILASVLYGEQFRESRLYSDMLLQGIFVVFAIYGWWHWYRGLKAEGSVRVETPAVGGADARLRHWVWLGACCWGIG